MFTVCPRCALSLAVTAADLRIGQGYVRCGRCASVFNALATLCDDAPASASDLGRTWEPGAARDTDPGPAIAPAERPEPLEESLEFTLGTEEVGRIFVEAPPDDPDLGTGTFESIVLEGEGELDALEATTDGVEAAANDDVIIAAVDEPYAEAPAPHPSVPEELPSLPAAVSEPQPQPSAAPVAEEIEPPPERTALARWLAAAGVASLALLLLAQWVHHRRNDLAAVPTLHAPLAAIYRSLGSPLAPRWDLRAYEVRQMGAAAATQSPGRIVVRASIRNGAARAQPLPVLRLKLHDRYGSVVAGRDLTPAEYLGPRVPRSGRLEAGQRADAEIAIVDPGKDAVGFEIDACLPSAPDRVRCAADMLAQTP